MSQHYHPILFSTPMVQALLRGDKTQTRRVNGLDHINENPGRWKFISHTGNNDDVPHPINTGRKGGLWYQFSTGISTFVCQSTFGDAGTILWGRETILDSKGYPVYLADNGSPDGKKWKPSIFMPATHCRIFLQVKSVRVERLHSITEADAIAEGIEETLFDTVNQCKTYRLYGWANAVTDSPIASYQSLWESINGKGSWDLNPWVWVYDFERVDKPEVWPVPKPAKKSRK